MSLQSAPVEGAPPLISQTRLVPRAHLRAHRSDGAYPSSPVLCARFGEQGRSMAAYAPLFPACRVPRAQEAVGPPFLFLLHVRDGRERATT